MAAQTLRAAICQRGAVMLAAQRLGLPVSWSINSGAINVGGTADSLPTLNSELDAVKERVPNDALVELTRA